MVIERDTHCIYGRTDLQANLNEVLSNLVLISNKLTVRLTNSFKYLPDFLMVTISKVMQIFPEKKQQKEIQLNFTFIESPNSVTSIDFELSQSKMRNAQLHLTWKSWYLKNKGDKCLVCHLKNARLYLA